jgi:hypothetical protein
VKEQIDKNKDDQDAFDKVVDKKKLYTKAPSNIPRFDHR